MILPVLKNIAHFWHLLVGFFETLVCNIKHQFVCYLEFKNLKKILQNFLDIKSTYFKTYLRHILDNFSKRFTQLMTLSSQ